MHSHLVSHSRHGWSIRRRRQQTNENKRPGYPVRQEFMSPLPCEIWGRCLMLTLITQSNLTLSWFEPGLCGRSFAFFGSSPTLVVEVLGSILWGQNLNNCPNARPVTLCNSSSITRNITRFHFISISC